MRVRLLLISACLVAALAGCGDDEGGSGSDSDSDPKQTKVSADAYPAVKKFAASDVAIQGYGPVCDELAAVKEDGVAAATETTCRKVVTITKELEAVSADIRGCDSFGCKADEAEPGLGRYISSFLGTMRSHNSALERVLKPGPCLTSLKIPQQDLDTFERSLRGLPAAIKRYRRGDTRALQRLFRGGLPAPDPSPCKP